LALAIVVADALALAEACVVAGIADIVAGGAGAACGVADGDAFGVELFSSHPITTNPNAAASNIRFMTFS
jgi:hypothetical protein